MTRVAARFELTQSSARRAAKSAVTGVGIAYYKARYRKLMLLGSLDDVISTQRVALIELAVKSKLLLDSIDSWLRTHLAGWRAT